MRDLSTSGLTFRACQRSTDLKISGFYSIFQRHNEIIGLQHYKSNISVKNGCVVSRKQLFEMCYTIIIGDKADLSYIVTKKLVVGGFFLFFNSVHKGTK